MPTVRRYGEDRRRRSLPQANSQTVVRPSCHRAFLDPYLPKRGRSAGAGATDRPGQSPSAATVRHGPRSLGCLKHPPPHGQRQADSPGGDSCAPRAPFESLPCPRAPRSCRRSLNRTFACPGQPGKSCPVGDKGPRAALTLYRLHPLSSLSVGCDVGSWRDASWRGCDDGR